MKVADFFCLTRIPQIKKAKIRVNSWNSCLILQLNLPIDLLIQRNKSFCSGNPFNGLDF